MPQDRQRRQTAPLAQREPNPSSRHAAGRVAGLVGIFATLVLPVVGSAQPPRGQSPPETTPREAAPVDLTGTWVSVVSEEWRWRMVTPARGDFASIPLNEAGREAGMAWDPDADAAAGLECKAYGAPALMRIPGRVRISWQDDRTLRVETDAGTQTRLFHFDAPGSNGERPSLQGYSVANWERPPRGAGATEGLNLFSARIGRMPQSLEVRTSNLLPGYLRRNGAPYSGETTVQEFYDYHSQPNGDEWFTVTTIVTDPRYLNGVYVTSSDFKKEPDDSGWNPTPCMVR